MLGQTRFAAAEKQLLARFWRTASGFWFGRLAWIAWFLVAVLIARDTAIVTAICAEFLESRFLRRDWTQGSRRTLDAGAKIRAAGRRQSHADDLTGVGSHDHADHVARVVEQPSL